MNNHHKNILKWKLSPTYIRNIVPVFMYSRLTARLDVDVLLFGFIACFLSSPCADTVCEYEVQFHQRLEQERAQWNQYREAVERELGELRRRLSEGQEEENLEDEMKKVCLLRAFFKVLSAPLISANMES